MLNTIYFESDSEKSLQERPYSESELWTRHIVIEMGYFVQRNIYLDPGEMKRVGNGGYYVRRNLNNSLW
jgi:hypothetical protein